MPWPQYYDGKYWLNDFGKLYGIRAIPAMFLLDQQGNIVSTNARGERLGREVTRLLQTLIRVLSGRASPARPARFDSFGLQRPELNLGSLRSVFKSRIT